MDKNIEEQCPSNDYKQGQPNGKCWGNGHYKCKECEHYREDFKRLGQDYIDYAHAAQGEIQLTIVK